MTVLCDVVRSCFHCSGRNGRLCQAGMPVARYGKSDACDVALAERCDSECVAGIVAHVFVAKFVGGAGLGSTYSRTFCAFQLETVVGGGK